MGCQRRLGYRAADPGPEPVIREHPFLAANGRSNVDDKGAARAVLLGEISVPFGSSHQTAPAEPAS